MIAGDWKPTFEVIIEPDSGAWFVQCKELDYEGCGTTVDNAKENFSDGLMLTAEAHRTMLPPDHMCQICSATGKATVRPNLKWLVLSGPQSTGDNSA